MVVEVRDRAGNAVEVVGNPMKLPSHRVTPPARVPELGEDTASTLMELLHLTSEEIGALASDGVVVVSEAPTTHTRTEGTERQ